MNELLDRARRNLSIGADLGHECALEALWQAFAEIDRLVSPDANVEDAKRPLDERSAKGIRQYGVTTDKAGLTEQQWEDHLVDELADALVYLMARRRTRARISATTC